MGTNVTVWFWTDDERGAAQGAEAVFDEMKRLDKEMTTWDPKSEVLADQHGRSDKPVKVSEETYAVIERAVDTSKRSKGCSTSASAHSRACGSSTRTWTARCPTGGRQEAARARQLEGHRARREAALGPPQEEGMSITLGGIAKGYAVDKCVDILKKRASRISWCRPAATCTSRQEGTESWQVAFAIRVGRRTRCSRFAPVEDHSFSTSGDYERGFRKDGVPLPPHPRHRTGQPARASRSVTIRAKDAFTADAWSKVMFIMGRRIRSR